MSHGWLGPYGLWDKFLLGTAYFYICYSVCGVMFVRLCVVCALSVNVSDAVCTCHGQRELPSSASLSLTVLRHRVLI